MFISAKRLKILGEVLLLIPIGLLLILGVGEVMGGTISGWQHFIQLLPLLILAILAWLRPKAGGQLLIITSLTLAAFYFFVFSFPLHLEILYALILFGPVILAGFLFVKSSTFQVE